MDKLLMQSVDGVAANIDIIARHFPSCITEARDQDGQLVRGIDFEKLKIELSPECIPENVERYQFTWPGKMDAVRLSNQPSSATLRPCRDESVDFDTTSNLYIEGDNLEVLKVLRNCYSGKVKMVYIDPPYNTGNDFVYKDDFYMDKEEFLVQTGQFSREGVRLVKNTNSNGRYHSDWLNMIYPRIRLARELLSEDGVIFISIDDHEIENLLKVCSEVFGDINYVGIFPWRKRSAKSDVPFGVSQDYEWVLCFAKSDKFRASKEVTGRKYYESPDFPGRPWRTHDLKQQKTALERPNSFFDLVDPKNGAVYKPNPKATWRITKDTLNDYLLNSRIIFPGDYPFLNSKQPLMRYWRSDDEAKYGERFGRNAVSTHLPDNIKGSDAGTKELDSLFDAKVFDFPKPTDLILYFIDAINDPEALIVDFFSGSSSTAHAVLKKNLEDNGNRKFIMVQIQELTDPNKDAFNAGYKTICEIGKERIRRAGAAIKAESGLMAGDLDTGFRVLKLDSSNMMDVYYSADEVSLPGFSEFNIKEDRSGEDLLFQVMLDLGIELSSSIEVRNLAGHTVHVVDGGYLAACFDDRVSVEAARAIAGLNPHWFVMCDAAFGSDADADNIMQVFKAVSPMSQIRVI
ncbi:MULTISPECIES: site-specific DNA-methyltransferase [unclassified Anaerobiospirillum]|uniref:site-specific DNA-methyltransferase n=1 Tax=unclassified Anaerobiospirillum TaxID=2647410 RepID=UPI001FF4B463|nr:MULTISPECIES: site-specific DNA-methyltransferase [unclassified Anaerobiospirillum]MCK0533651.1 site-specific DNA-methyltransferase [Anaerobiospirillum sp. NML120511]MCK0539615.1 site-specific DNA-methyltransferase [Anaerobiospirillum sp. NML02-A-032]